MVVVFAVGAHGGGASSLEHLGEVSFLVEFQNVLLHTLVGGIGTEIDVVAEGEGISLIDTRFGSIDHTKLARLAVVGDDIGPLVHVVAHDVAVGHSVNHGPEGIHRHA